MTFEHKLWLRKTFGRLLTDSTFSSIQSLKFRLRLFLLESWLRVPGRESGVLAVLHLFQPVPATNRLVRHLAARLRLQPTFSPGSFDL